MSVAVQPVRSHTELEDIGSNAHSVIDTVALSITCATADPVGVSIRTVS